jgi:division protein CdvB (Snf7/Vps24/ESCRT-III family)
LGNQFINRWKEKEKEPSKITQKIKNVGKQQEPLKDQINTVIQRLETQSRSLDAAVQRFELRDRSLFASVVQAMANHDNARANIYATELSEIRKVEKMLSHASLALQSMSMRLSTVSDMGDIVTVLGPAKKIISGIGSEMCGILPEASAELGNIGNLLGDIVTTTCGNQEMAVEVGGRASPEAEAILQEAMMTMETKLQEQLPEVGIRKTLREPASLEV